jgi:hypothetical protein
VRGIRHSFHKDYALSYTSTHVWSCISLPSDVYSLFMVPTFLLNRRAFVFVHLCRWILGAVRGRCVSRYVFHSCLAGSFGRVKVARYLKADPKATMDDAAFVPPRVAIKCLKKAAIIKLKQVDHITNEKNILLMLEHPLTVGTSPL